MQKARVLKTNLLPKNVVAMAIWPFIIVNASREISAETIAHEKIHLRQQIETFLIGFYLWYGIEYLIRLIQYKGDDYLAYKNISFEREAFSNEDVEGYLDRREPLNFMKYL
jgi:hypothetical protein